MEDSSTQSLTIGAAPNDVMAVIADFAAYPQWADAIKQLVVTRPGPQRAERVRFTMDAGIIKDTYELEYTWAPDGLSVSWELLSGEMQKAQQGSYVLRPVAGGQDGQNGPVTEVTYSLTVQLAIPLIGALRRKAERTIMNTALTQLRRRVESLRA